MSDLLRRTAKHAARHPEMLASVLTRYAATEHIDDAALADRLGCPPDRLGALLWCRRPREEHFGEDMRAIAELIGLDIVSLANMIRQMDALELIDAAGRSKHSLLAARDREQERPDES